MVEVRREITKEFYEENATAPRAKSTKAVDDLLGIAITAGYGVYGYYFTRDEKEDKYYLVYSRGSSCD